MVTAVLQRSNPHQPRTRGRLSASRWPSSRPGRRGFAAPGAALAVASARRWGPGGGGGRASAKRYALCFAPSGGPGVDAWPNHTRKLLSMAKAAGPLRRAGEPSSLRLIGPGLESLVFLLFFLVFLRARARTARKALCSKGLWRFLSYLNSVFFRAIPVFFRAIPSFSERNPHFRHKIC